MKCNKFKIPAILRVRILPILITLYIALFNSDLFSKTDDWTTSKTKDGKVTASYYISKTTNSKGESVPLVEYSACTKEKMSMQKSISVMKNISKHKDFQGDKVSKKIKTISANEWILYYYSKTPWPLSDIDCVTKMTINEDPDGKKVIFKFTAKPNLSDKTKAKRMSLYDVTYTLEDLGEGNVEVKVDAKMSPPIKVPNFMMKSAFPSTVFDVIEKFIKLVKEN